MNLHARYNIFIFRLNTERNFQNKAFFTWSYLSFLVSSWTNITLIPDLMYCLKNEETWWQLLYLSLIN